MGWKRLASVAFVASIALIAAACTPPTTGGANQAPIAVVTAFPTTGVAPLTVNFESVASHDPDGTIVLRTWDFGDGSPQTNVANPVHTYASSGTFLAKLTVKDDKGASRFSTITIMVTGGNVSPTAAANATPTSGHAPLAVAFSSAGSTDSDGTIAGYSWDFGDGSAVDTSPNPSHTYTAAGTNVAVLTVTDDDGATNSASVTITVGANVAPSAVASATPDSGKLPLDVDFSSAGSTDSDGTVTGYSWDFGDGSALDTSPNPSHTYAAANTYTAILTVTDNGGATGTASVPITVVANVSPTAGATATPTTGRAPLAVSFNSSTSDDSDGTITGYSWDFDDGSALDTSANPSHTYTTAGSYDAVLTVTDDNGATASTTVTILATVNTAPTAVANSNAITGTAPATINFDASGSTDPDGTIATYAWDFGDSTSGTGAIVSHQYATAGTYNATVTVTDNEGASTTSTAVTITVTDDAAGRYVATTGTDSGTCSSSLSPCLTITYAVGQAASGDTVHIAAGNYPEIVEITKPLVFRGPNAGIDGNAARGPEAVVKGFSNPNAGSISGVNSDTITGSITNATNTSTFTGVTGAGAISNATGAGTITNATNTNPIVYTTAVANTLVTGDLVKVTGVVGNTAANLSTALAVTVIDDTHFSVAKAGNGAYASGGVYTGAPVFITTTAPHGLTIGATYASVTIAGLLGNTSAIGSGSRSITVTDATHFKVNGVTGNGAYTGGGTYSNILAVVTTATPHGLANGSRVNVTGVTGTTSLNTTNKVVTVIDDTHFTMATNANAAYTGGGVSTTTAVTVTTAAPHGLPVTGTKVTITGVGGNTAANVTNLAATILDATHFSVVAVPNGDYSGGGTFTAAPVIITTAEPHGLASGGQLTVVGVRGATGTNIASSTITVDPTHLLVSSATASGAYTGGGRYGNPLGGSVSAASNTSPIVITTQGPNGVKTGQTVAISGIAVNTAANGTFSVTAIDSTHFSLNGTTGNGVGTTGTYVGPYTSLEIDGLKIDPQGDASYIGASLTPLVSLFGGPSVLVHNTVFDGGPYSGGCSFTCTTMTDVAFDIRSGGQTFEHNLVTNFRRPTTFGMSTTALPTTSVTVDSNTYTHVTSRAITTGESTGISTMPGAHVTNNVVDGTGITAGSTPAGLVTTYGGQTISGNSFTGLSSGIFLDVCRKFSTRDNVITGNTFTANGGGIQVFDEIPFGGQCASASAGGDIVGTIINGNNFVGNIGYGVGGSYLTGIDATCNWWNDAAGPSAPGADKALGGVNSSPWLVAPAPGGACTGS